MAEIGIYLKPKTMLNTILKIINLYILLAVNSQNR